MRNALPRLTGCAQSPNPFDVHHTPRPAEPGTLRSGVGQARPNSLPCEFALKLGDRREDVEKKFALGGGSVTFS